MSRIKSKAKTRRQPGTRLDQEIVIRGAAEHNLKAVDIVIPKNKLVVFTGVSGSGKSSLAFDTIFAEGQRRYVESLSSYARQFLGQMEKPKYEMMRGLSPTIAIEQKAASKNPRSTVGTITEIFDYLRVLYARIGVQTCHRCGKDVGRGDAQSIVSQLAKLPEKDRLLILAPLVQHRKGEHKDLLEEMRREGFQRVRVNGVVSKLEDVQTLAKHKKHNIDLVIDRLQLASGSAFLTRLTDSVEQALEYGKGQMIAVHESKKTSQDIWLSESRSCCGHAFAELDPPLFSFNSPQGMCPSCNGLGTVLAMDVDKLIPDPELSIREGAIIVWRNYFLNHQEQSDGSWTHEKFHAIEHQLGVDFDTPWKKLPEKQKQLVLYGKGAPELTVQWEGDKSSGTWTFTFEGLLPTYMRRYLKTKSESMKSWYQKYMSTKACEQCHGQRLKEEVLAVKLNHVSIMQLCDLAIEDIIGWFDQLVLNQQQEIIAGELLKEIKSRLHFLQNVGLNYLSLNRYGPSLSGGEAQRIRLASQIGSELTGVLYILDEPSIGLHQRDNRKLIQTLHHLRDIGNSVIVVEHDQETIEASDWVADFGPGAGVQGGEIVAFGTPKQIKSAKNSLTGQYLRGKKSIPCPEVRRSVSVRKGPCISIKKARENNLKQINVSIPLGVFTAVAGVSGAGKSTLINQILYPAMARHLYNSQEAVGKHDSIEGLEQINKVINIDQKPIGRTPRSNPATYTKVFDLIRDFYAQLPEAKLRGFRKGRFSFNVKGGRCEHCQGDGSIKVEMHFLADVFVPCEVCHGRRFNDATCEVRYKGHSIADVLDLTTYEARQLFANHPKIVMILDTLIDVGLSYLKLGQAATTLSGGEAQRIKLARELAKRETGSTFYILDEPTTGLHFEDIAHLLLVLQRLVDAGNTVLVIEHNLDVIKCADWVIDMGPEGGALGGKVVASGTPEQIARNKKSVTGAYLQGVLTQST